jgi:hypothetical protein
MPLSYPIGPVIMQPIPNPTAELKTGEIRLFTFCRQGLCGCCH